MTADRARLDVPTHDTPAGGYVTLLADAAVAAGAVVGLAGRVCTVDADAAPFAHHGSLHVVRLGTWPATFAGRRDAWSVWWGIDRVWAATSDVQTAPHAVRLIAEFAEACGEANAAGRDHQPLPPLR